MTSSLDPSRRRGAHHAEDEGRLRRALRRLPGTGDELRELCDAHGLALIEDVAHAPTRRLGRPQARHAAAWPAASRFFSNKILSVGEGGLLATDDDDVAAFARTRRSHAMTSGTLDRHLGRTTTYDVSASASTTGSTSRARALRSRGSRRLEADIARRRELMRRYRDRARDRSTASRAATRRRGRAVLLLRDADHDRRPRGVSSRCATRLREQHGVQTSLFYPAIHEFTAYRARFPGVSLPQTERAARSELTIPLYPHMTHRGAGPT